MLSVSLLNIGGYAEVWLHGPLVELELKEFPIRVVGYWAKGSGCHGGAFHMIGG
jgi:hypothetical protein